MPRPETVDVIAALGVEPPEYRPPRGSPHAEAEAIATLIPEIAEVAGALSERLDAAAARRRRLGDVPRSTDADGRRITLTRASEIEPQVVRWAWQERMPLGALTIIAGQPGLGKSTLTVYLGAAVSTGRLPGSLNGHPADVLYVTLEDHLASVVRPRLQAAGADLDRVHLVGVEVDDREELVTLPGDLDGIEAHVQRTRARLLVIDPIVATLDGRLDSHRDQSVRRALAPLAQFAERAEIAVVGVMHLSKQQGADLLNRVSGSVAFGGAARAVLAYARDPEDPDGEEGYQRVLVTAKSNWGRYAPSLRCRIETAAIETREGPSEQSTLTILGECDTTAADLTSGHEPGDVDDAVDLLAELLADGPRPSREVKTEVVAQLDCSPRTVGRAARRLGVEIERRSERHARTIWRLPSTRDTPPVASTSREYLSQVETGSSKPNETRSDSTRDRDHGAVASTPTPASESLAEQAVARYGKDGRGR